MSSALAALIFMAVIVVLLRRDIQRNHDLSAALWIPLIWMFLAGGRWASSWLNLRPPMDSADAFSEGSPLDRIVFLLLIIAGATVLLRRGLEWGKVMRANALLVTYLLFCLISATWSDEPLTLMKRWIKELGNPIMVLILLTDKNPLRAIGAVLRRLSYFFLLLSVLFIKYYPHLGRAYHHDGSPMYTGVGQQKNQLGQICLLALIYFAWLLFQRREEYLALVRFDRLSVWMLAAVAAWLQYMSNSQTALSCFVVCLFIMLMARLKRYRAQPGRLPVALLLLGITFAVLEASFDLKASILVALGRRPDLTNRAEIWGFLLGMGTNPVVGTGFMSFWMGERMDQVWLAIGTIQQAHSGYVEQYINLGGVGVAFIVLMFVRAFMRIRSELPEDIAFAMLRLCFLVAGALYNYTEAAFYGISNIWILLLVAIIRAPLPETVSRPLVQRPSSGPRTATWPTPR